MEAMKRECKWHCDIQDEISILHQQNSKRDFMSACVVLISKQERERERCLCWFSRMNEKQSRWKEKSFTCSAREYRSKISRGVVCQAGDRRCRIRNSLINQVKAMEFSDDYGESREEGDLDYFVSTCSLIGAFCFQIMSLMNYFGAPEEWPFLPVDASFVVRHSYQSTYSHTRSVTAEHDFTDDRVFNHRLCSPFSLKIQFDSLLIQFLFNLLEILHTAVHI